MKFFGLLVVVILLTICLMAWIDGASFVLCWYGLFASLLTLIITWTYKKWRFL
jgi:hypothetical protein